MLSPEILKKIETITIKGRRLVNDVFAGEYETAFKGRGMSFEEVREYFPGDEVRTIDWNVTARMDKPYVKVFREEREQTVMILVDASASNLFGSKTKLKQEAVALIAAILSYAAVKSGDKVGLIMFTDRVEKYVPPKKGGAHIWHVISEILSFKPAHQRTEFTPCFKFFDRVIHRRSVCFVLSDFWADDVVTPLTTAHFKHEVVALMVRDPLEMNVPAAGLMALRDLETGQEAVVDWGSASVRKSFAQVQEKKTAGLLKTLKSYSVDTLLFSPSDDPIEPLLKFFRRREKRA